MKKQVKKILAGGLALSLLLTGCGAGGSTFATVNGEKIAQERYDVQLDVIKSMIAAQYQLPESIKKQLVQEVVMRQDLEKNEVKLTDEDYKEDFDKAVEAYGGAEGYRRTLEVLKISDDQMKEMLKFETISRKHKEMYAQKNAPSEEEIKKYFEDNKDSLVKVDASHILVPTEEEAKEAKKRIDGGESFEDVAKAVSKDGSAQAGGSLGIQNPGKYDPVFAKALLALKEGEISDPVQTQFGYHIIRLNKNYNTADSVKDEILTALTADAYQEYLQKLVDEAKVEFPGEKKEEESSQASDQSEAESGESKEEPGQESQSSSAEESK
ncbi:MAG: peptidylprolyl isomerase [Firmicutes bacterium]|nr:peptidylprolyl isomerase [Bacillota bacterium]